MFTNIFFIIRKINLNISLLIICYFFFMSFFC